MALLSILVLGFCLLRTSSAAAENSNLKIKVACPDSLDSNLEVKVEIADTMADLEETKLAYLESITNKVCSINSFATKAIEVKQAEIDTAIGNLLSTIDGSIQTAGSFLTTLLGSVISELKTVLPGISTQLKNIITEVTNSLDDILVLATTLLSENFDKLKDVLNELKQTIANVDADATSCVEKSNPAIISELKMLDQMFTACVTELSVSVDKALIPFRNSLSTVTSQISSATVRVSDASSSYISLLWVLPSVSRSISAIPSFLESQHTEAMKGLPEASNGVQTCVTNAVTNTIGNLKEVEIAVKNCVTAIASVEKSVQ